MTRRQMLEAIAAIFEDELTRIRELDRRVSEECGIQLSDSVADVRARISDGSPDRPPLVEVIYDGAGYDHFSYETAEGKATQERLNAEIAKVDPRLHIEQTTSWSLRVEVP